MSIIMTEQDTVVEIIQIQPRVSTAITGSDIPEPSPGRSDVSQLATFDKILLRETNVATPFDHPVSWDYTVSPTIWSSPVELTYYYEVSNIDGSYEFIAKKDAKMVGVYSIPPLHSTSFQHLPVEVLNYYFSGVC